MVVVVDSYIINTMQRASQLKTAQATGAAKLSRAWRVSKQHRGVYTGGKWQVVPTLPLKLAETLDQDHQITEESTTTISSEDELDGLLFCLCDGDVSVVRVQTGELIMTVQGRYDLAEHDQSKQGSKMSDAKAQAGVKTNDTAFVGEDIHEEIVEFAVHPKGHEIVTVSRQLLVRHWVLKITEELQLLPEKEHSKVENVSDKSSSSIDETNSNLPVRLHARWENVRSWKSQHRGAVTSMAYDPSGTLVATAGTERVVKVWDVPRGYCTHNLKMKQVNGGSSVASAGAVSLVTFHPDPHRLMLFACTEDDNSVRVYDLVTSSLLATHSHHMSSPTSIAFSNDGWTMVTGGRDKVLNIYSLRNHTLLRTAPVYDAVEGLVFCSSNNYENNEMQHDVASSKYNTSHWLTCGDGGAMKIWRFQAHKTRKGQGSTAFDCVGTSGKCSSPWSGMSSFVSNKVVATTKDHNFEFWDTSSSSSSSASPSSSEVVSVPSLFSDDLKKSTEGTYRLHKTRQIVGYNDDIIDVQFIPPSVENSHTVASTDIVVATNSSDIRIVNLKTFNCELVSGHTDIVLAVTVSSDGHYIASVSKDRTVNVFRIGDGTESTKRIGCGKGHTESVGAVAFGNSPIHSGTPPILLTGSLDKTIKAWDMRSMLMSLEDDEEEIEDDSNESVVYALRVRTSSLAHDMDINCMAVSPNDKMAATASQDKTIKLWSMETLRDNEEIKLLSVLRGHKRGVWDLAFSPVDRMLASASGDGTVRLWSLNPDMYDTPCVRTFEGHTASVLRVQFVNAGLQVMSCGADGLVKLWTLRGTGTECVNTFDRHRDKVWAMASRSWVGIDNDNGNDEKEEPSVQTQLVTGGGDSILNVWMDCTLEEDMDEIREREILLLKEQELSNLVHLKKYGRAIKLALELDFPLKLRTILEELLLGEAPKAKVSLRGIDLATRNKYKGEEGERMVRNVIITLSEAHLSQCLKYISIWNTNARHALLAQWLLYIVVSSKANDEILRAIKSCPTPADVLISGLIAYTDRHSVRMDRLIEDSYLLDYTLSSMKMLFEIENHNGGTQDTSAMMMNLISSSEEDDDDEESEEESGEESGEEEIKINKVERNRTKSTSRNTTNKKRQTSNKRTRSSSSLLNVAPTSRRRRKAK